MICPRCGSPDFIDNDGPIVCRECLRAAVVAVVHPEMLSPGVVRLLERDHGDVVRLDRSGKWATWRWVGP